jgi:putative transposase
MSLPASSAGSSTPGRIVSRRPTCVQLPAPRRTYTSNPGFRAWDTKACLRPPADQLAHGRRFRILNVVDDVTRECLAAVPDTSISGKRVARELTLIVGARGKPQMVVSGNGTEFTSNAMLMWANDHDVNWPLPPGRPMQNSYIESSNGRMRDELLNESLFIDLDQARWLIAAWVADYNTGRPHSSLGYKTPAAYAGTLTAPKGVTSVEALTAAG